MERSAICARRSTTSRPGRDRRAGLCCDRRPPTARWRRRRAARRVRAWLISASSPIGSMAPVLTLPAWQHTMVGRPRCDGKHRSRSAGSIAPLASTATCSIDLRAEAQEPSRPWNGHVHLVADDKADRRGTREPVGLDIPTCRRQHMVPSRGERRRVGHLAAGDKSKRRLGWQTEQVEHPTAGDLLDHRGRRARREQARCFGPKPVTNQSAASAAGNAPPITKPKNRPESMPISPPASTASAIRCTTAAGSAGCCGVGPPRAARNSSGVAVGVTTASRKCGAVRDATLRDRAKQAGFVDVVHSPGNSLRSRSSTGLFTPGEVCAGSRRP